MPESNYKSQWWGYIYDQMMENRSDWVENNQRFYLKNLEDVHGPVLECTCGTGIFLLPLLQSGFDMYDFDISPSMLAALQKKAAVQGIENIADRISIQDLESFHYEQRFDAILIPTNSFGMLVTQEAQVRSSCLPSRNGSWSNAIWPLRRIKCRTTGRSNTECLFRASFRVHLPDWESVPMRNPVRQDSR